MSVIRWEDPPPHGNLDRKRPSKYQPIADALRAQPGEWALIAEGLVAGSAGPLAVRIRTGSHPFGPAGAFEARAIGPAGGSSAKVYARYVGEGDA